MCCDAVGPEQNINNNNKGIIKAGEHAELGRKTSISSSGPVVWICAEKIFDSPGVFQSVLSIKTFAAPHTILPANRLVLHKELGGDKLFRRAQQGKRSSGVALYMECFDCLGIDSGDERVKG